MQPIAFRSSSTMDFPRLFPRRIRGHALKPGVKWSFRHISYNTWIPLELPRHTYCKTWE